MDSHTHTPLQCRLNVGMRKHWIARCADHFWGYAEGSPVVEKGLRRQTNCASLLGELKVLWPPCFALCPVMWSTPTRPWPSRMDGLACGGSTGKPSLHDDCRRSEHLWTLFVASIQGPPALSSLGFPLGPHTPCSTESQYPDHCIYLSPSRA